MVSKEAAQEFLALLQQEMAAFDAFVSSEDGDWTVKGFIDIFKNVYTISGDTKVVSKLIEIMLFPQFVNFAAKHGYKLILSWEQNHYPDLTFVSETGCKFAVDLKSTYRLTERTVNSMTLGAFTGYFRNRLSSKNVTFPYAEYSGHFVLGVFYSRAEAPIDQLKIHAIEELKQIPSVVRDLRFFAQPKYRIAKDLPGSGNTKNIGSVGTISELIEGAGPFATLGEEIFDDYWMHYLTLDMARAVEMAKPPYRNLATYFEYKKLPEEPVK